MSNNFDLTKYLVENKLTTNSKALNEAPNIPVPGNKPKMPPVPGNKPKMPPVPGNKPKMPPVPGKESSNESEVNELHGGYLEVMGDDFHVAAQEIAKAWTEWRNGPATEPEDIEPAREDVIEFLKSMIR